DGSIDAAASDARRAQATDPSMQRGRHNPSLRPVPEAAVGAVAETLREQGLPAPQAAGGMTYLQARTANEVLKAQERKMRLQKLRGELVDRARAIAMVFRLARQERESLSWLAGMGLGRLPWRRCRLRQTSFRDNALRPGGWPE
ncbi:MAG: hypothetical protein WAS73_01390, partial [Defluviicoccus sp.]